MVILHHSQPSSAHVVQGMGYSMANFSLAYIVHTHYTNAHYVPHPLGPCPLCSMLIMTQVHYATSPLSPILIFFNAHYAPCPMRFE